MGATNLAGLAFNGCRFGGSHKRASTQSASGLDGCCGEHIGVHGMNYIEDAYKTLKLAGQNRRTSSGFVIKSQNAINKIAPKLINTLAADKKELKLAKIH